MPPVKNLGANIDTRPEEKKQKDINIKETVASFAPVNWLTKQQPTGLQFDLRPGTWRKFPLQNQDGSGSCVAQTKKKTNGINVAIKTGRYATFSATHTYQRRFNKPASGMSGDDCFEIERNGGVTLEEFAPSELMTDAQMDAFKVEGPALDIAKIFLGSNHVGLDPKNIDQLASTIQATGGKGVMVWFYFTYAEWGDVPVVLDPNLSLTADSTLRHSVTAIDYFLWNGKKAVLIEDSWGEFGQFKGQRIITEDFYKARNWYARYSLGFKYEEGTPTPTPVTHKFVMPMQFIPLNPSGEISDPVLHGKQKAEVVFAQDFLKKQGVMPVNVASTGYYGSLTAKAVVAFAKLYSLDISTSPLGYNIGPRIMAKFNDLQGLK